MTDVPRQAVTTLLLQWRQGNKAALDQLLPIVYDELRRVARARLKSERAGHALQTTVLVHEAYLRLVQLDRMTVHDRAHFFALSSRLMRQILVDHARRTQADKRGGEATIIGLDDASDPAGKAPNLDVLALDEALDQLTAIDPRLSRVVELKFFAGLNIDEIAAALEVSAATVERDWAFARAWLFERLSSGAHAVKPAGH
jgi:RNA polymerase sigma factor (TIGR02999 family)